MKVEIVSIFTLVISVSCATDEGLMRKILLRMLENELHVPEVQDNTDALVDRQVEDMLDAAMEKRQQLAATGVRDLRASKDRDGCDTGGITTCGNNQCDLNHSTCRLGCDNFGFLNPDKNVKEHYSCQCIGMRWVGAFCSVDRKEVCAAGKPGSECVYCFRTKQTYSGYYCYDQKWDLVNTQDVISRSLREEKVTEFIRAARNLLTND